MVQVIPSLLQRELLNRITARLINPSQNEIGRISKHTLDQINKKLPSKLTVNKLKDAMSVINRCCNIHNKKLCKLAV